MFAEVHRGGSAGIQLCLKIQVLGEFFVCGVIMLVILYRVAERRVRCTPSNVNSIITAKCSSENKNKRIEQTTKTENMWYKTNKHERNALCEQSVCGAH